MNPGITRLRILLTRHLGWRGLCVALAFALTCMTWPQWEVHVHATADHAHAHLSHHDAAHPAPAPDAETGGVAHVHVHDAQAASFMPSTRTALVTSAPSSLRHASPTVTAAACPAWPPPHRPPIA